MIDASILRLHADLRKAQRGKWAAFLGAGSSYDYGIPIMSEMANILKPLIEGIDSVSSNDSSYGVSDETLKLLKLLVPQDIQNGTPWDLEQLLARLHQLYDATSCAGLPFTPASASIKDQLLSPENINRASNELLLFVAKMCELTAQNLVNHTKGSIEYLADFVRSFSTFGNTLKVFTTNLDLCIEAALVQLSQRARRFRRPEFLLIDGFDGGIVPTFNLRNYGRDLSTQDDVHPVYYWKLHGSIDWTFSSPLDINRVNGKNENSLDTCNFNDESIIVRRNDTRWNELHDCGALSSPPDHSKHRIVIFPTPAKYSQTYTFPYMDLFEAFRRTLEEIGLLIVVGTSFPDQHIRSAISSFCQRDNVLLYVVDPSMTRDKLVSLFGDVKAIQPVIAMGFKAFIEQFLELESPQNAGQKFANKEG